MKDTDFQPDAGHFDAEEPATISLYRDGPLIVRGCFQILDGAGNEIDPGRATVALCRCGRSALKPFCDGSHVATRFRAASRDERPQQLSAGATDALRFDHQAIFPLAEAVTDDADGESAAPNV